MSGKYLLNLDWSLFKLTYKKDETNKLGYNRLWQCD
jgi:hypothetical protein